MSQSKKSATTPKPRNRKATLPAKPIGPGVVSVVMPDGTWTRDRLFAEIAVDGTMATAQTIQTYAYGHMGEHGSMQQTVDSLRGRIRASQNGSTAFADELLIGQAVALNTVFNELLRRAALNMGSYPEEVERYMRLGFKAQSQCRATLESLSKIKNPATVSFVKQANIANGPQQVNNCTPLHEVGQSSIAARTEESGSAQIELLENNNGEWMDTRATGTAGRGHPAMATVGQVHRAEDEGGEVGRER